MHVRCWGSRGQIPVSGQEFNKYGGDTTCIEIRSRKNELIIIDAGSGIRHLGSRIMEEEIREANIVFTHLHLDHILGFPFFNPVYDRRFSCTIHGCPFDSSSFHEALHGMMKPPYFPVDLNDLPCKISYRDILTQPFEIGDVQVAPISLNHPNGALGFRFEENGTVFVFLTDNELGFDAPGARPVGEYMEFCKGADLLIHDAEFDEEEYGRYKAWGHSRYTDAVDLAINAGVGRLGLFHINHKRTDRQVDDMVRDSCKLISRHGAAVECSAIGSSFEMEL